MKKPAKKKVSQRNASRDLDVKPTRGGDVRGGTPKKDGGA